MDKTIYRNEGEEFKKAVLDSLDNLYIEKSKEKVLNKFFC